MDRLIPADEIEQWRGILSRFSAVDATYLPEYHLAYALRVSGSSPWLWHFCDNGRHFIYPFLLTPVVLDGDSTPYFDISSIYGFTGPLSTAGDAGFLQNAWEAFDAYAAHQQVIAEFIRFSPFSNNESLAHPQTVVLANRTVAASRLTGSPEALLQSLGPKTRNMLRKAQREGLTARELELPASLPVFRTLYNETMERNQAPGFFRYDDAYWGQLLRLGPRGLRLFGSFAGDQLVAASMAIAQGGSGLYHLGASLTQYAKLGAGNLSLYAMSCGLMAGGVTFLNMTGGRTAHPDDPLLLFKRSNANDSAVFHIGKRVINPAAYNALATRWEHMRGAPPDPEKLIFWR
jgi:hypothetical protein